MVRVSFTHDVALDLKNETARYFSSKNNLFKNSRRIAIWDGKTWQILAKSREQRGGEAGRDCFEGKSVGGEEELVQGMASHWLSGGGFSLAE